MHGRAHVGVSAREPRGGARPEITSRSPEKLTSTPLQQKVFREKEAPLPKKLCTLAPSPMTLHTLDPLAPSMVSTPREKLHRAFGAVTWVRPIRTSHRPRITTCIPRTFQKSTLEAPLERRYIYFRHNADSHRPVTRQ